MPSWKYKPPIRGSKSRDFWGDENKGAKFGRLVDKKFGTHLGARAKAIKTLFPHRDMSAARRSLNMYITGERSIPDDVLAKLKSLKDFDPSKLPARIKNRKVNKSVERLKKIRRDYAPRITGNDDDVDPLS